MPTTKKTKNSKATRSRQLNRKQAKLKAKKVAKKKTLPSTWSLLKSAFNQIEQNKKLFIGIMVVYLLLTMIFVKGISGNFQISSIQQNVIDSLGEQSGKLQRGTASYGILLGSAVSAPGDVESIYQTILIMIAGLATIWALRKTYNERPKVQIRDAFYKGMYPLIPYLIVLFVMLMYCLPLGITSTIFSAIQANGLAVSGPEQLIWTSVLIAGGLLTAYLLLSAVFAIYIVTLPNMRPIKALKEANALVKFRRWQIAKKFIIFFGGSLLVSAIVLIPLIIFFARGAEVIYLVFSMLFMVLSNAFTYRIYRQLI